MVTKISIHALLAESDTTHAHIASIAPHFYPRSPCGERLRSSCKGISYFIFLSTLSLRRATHLILCPKSAPYISIHALLAESDREPTALRTPHQRFLSTLSLRRATAIDVFLAVWAVISIHALLAESDDASKDVIKTTSNFYPRSPCGERQPFEHHASTQQEFLSTLSLRRATEPPRVIREPTADFYPRSPCGERLHLILCPKSAPYISIHALLAESDHNMKVRMICTSIFLSTLSLRRATSIGPLIFSVQPHFYPRSPCGERQWIPSYSPTRCYFYPRSPCGERPPLHDKDVNPDGISIHALLAESDSKSAQNSGALLRI